MESRNDFFFLDWNSCCMIKKCLHSALLFIKLPPMLQGRGKMMLMLKFHLILFPWDFCCCYSKYEWQSIRQSIRCPSCKTSFYHANDRTKNHCLVASWHCSFGLPSFGQQLTWKLHHLPDAQMLRTGAKCEEESQVGISPTVVIFSLC